MAFSIGSALRENRTRVYSVAGRDGTPLAGLRTRCAALRCAVLRCVSLQETAGLTPGLHHSVAVLPLPFRRSAFAKFRCSVKITQ